MGEACRKGGKPFAPFAPLPLWHLQNESGWRGIGTKLQLGGVGGGEVCKTVWSLHHSWAVFSRRLSPSLVWGPPGFLSLCQTLQVVLIPSFSLPAIRCFPDFSGDMNNLGTIKSLHSQALSQTHSIQISSQRAWKGVWWTSYQTLLGYPLTLLVFKGS